MPPFHLLGAKQLHCFPSFLQTHCFSDCDVLFFFFFWTLFSKSASSLVWCSVCVVGFVVFVAFCFSSSEASVAGVALGIVRHCCSSSAEAGLHPSIRMCGAGPAFLLL